MCLSCISRKTVYTALLLLIFLSVVFQQLPRNQQKPQPLINPSPTESTTQLMKVARVVDGDTIELENGEKVRYIGINTPELHDPRKPMECFSKEAYEKNKELVEGKTIAMEKDVSEKDKYGRLLRYVFLYNPQSTPEALFINQYLVREGFAYAATYPPDVKYANVFKDEQTDALAKKKGLWNNCPTH